MNYQRLVTFAVLIVLGGLVQLWVVCLLLVVRGTSVNFSETLADGSLFFFSTSLVYSSWFAIVAADKPQNTGQSSFVISLVCVGFVTFIAVPIYSAAATEAARAAESAKVTAASPNTNAGDKGLNSEIEKKKKESSSIPPYNYLMAQLITAIVAVSYAFYASASTGVFHQAPPVVENV